MKAGGSAAAVRSQRGLATVPTTHIESYIRQLRSRNGLGQARRLASRLHSGGEPIFAAWLSGLLAGACKCNGGASRPQPHKPQRRRQLTATVRRAFTAAASAHCTLCRVAIYVWRLRRCYSTSASAYIRVENDKPSPSAAARPGSSQQSRSSPQTACKLSCNPKSNRWPRGLPPPAMYCATTPAGKVGWAAANQ